MFDDQYAEVTISVRADLADELQRYSQELVEVAEHQARIRIRNRQKGEFERQQLQENLAHFWSKAPIAFRKYRRIRPSVTHCSQVYSLVGREMGMASAGIEALVRFQRRKLRRYLLGRRNAKVLALRLKGVTHASIANHFGYTRQTIHRVLSSIRARFLKQARPLQSEILALALNGKRQKEIILALHCSRQTIFRTLKLAHQIARLGHV